MRIAQGSSYAVSNLLRYTIIVCGFLIGLGEMGVTLNRVIILISAFGVGISFGMQNIVNNFISGLILLFERPVHVGDKIEFGTTIGEVSEIGIRSSKVRTYTGADIIVPNSQLVTDQVINWTFSDRLRRIDLPFGVNYGAEPCKVIELAERTARSNSRILPSKPCVCLFTGYGDSSINFELRAWTDQFDDWAVIRSELAVAVYNAICASEFYFPFPQREVRMLNFPEPEPEAHESDPPKDSDIGPKGPPEPAPG
jgi:small-conductance mechanosensitive channel